jgi:hypothetical protein
MEALDPIDVMSVKAGYYTRLSLEEQRRHPALVALLNGDTDGVDLAGSRGAFEHELTERLRTEFPDAIEVEVVCVDGRPLGETATEVGLTRPSDERMLIATRWVDALVNLIWAHGRWIAPKSPV